MANNIENQDKNELVANCNQLAVVDNIESLIKMIRGQQVMLDRDLATLYGVETKRLNEQIKRNVKRFPEDFMFQLTKEECLRSQIATLNEGRGHHLKYMPYVFTENGVAMLSSVLRSDTAIEVNIRIMRAFTSMRHFLLNNAEVFQRLSTMEYHQLEMQQRIVLIDNYVDETVLTLLDKRKEGVSAVIYTQQISRQLQLDIDRHNAQYDPVAVETFRLSHDRFLCIDDEVYHIGASIKDLGKKWFGFSKMEILTPDELVERINRG